MSDLEDITPEGSTAPVYLDLTPPAPLEVPTIEPIVTAIRQQSPNGQWWEQRVNNAGQSVWIPVDLGPVTPLPPSQNAPQKNRG